MANQLVTQPMNADINGKVYNIVKEGLSTPYWAFWQRANIPNAL
jgi:hypothetical protein